MGTLVVELHAFNDNRSRSSSRSGGAFGSGQSGPLLLRGALPNELDVEVVLRRCNGLAKAVNARSLLTSVALCTERCFVQRSDT